MKSRKSIGNFIRKVKDKIDRFIYTEESLELAKQNEGKTDGEEISKSKISFGVIIPIVILVLLVIGAIVQTNKENRRLESLRGEYYVQEVSEENKAQIDSKKYTNLFYNTKTKKTVKMAYTTLNDQIAYSLTYGNDDVVKGELTTTKYFTKGHVTTIFLKGYPNVGYKDMGLDSEEDAYYATQLAIYEMAEHKEYSMRGEGFSLDDITCSKKQDDARCKKIIAKAKELYNYANDNPYESQTDEITTGFNHEPKKIEGGYIDGPYISTLTTDDITKDYLKDKYVPEIELTINSILDNTKSVIVDKDGNELKKVMSGDEFYVKVESNEKVFSLFKVLAHNYYLSPRIYKSDSSDKQYVALRTQDLYFVETGSVISGMDTGIAWIWFNSESEEVIDGVSFKLYTEDGKLIEDADGYSNYYEYKLPVGKYYVEVYDIPKDHFLENKKYEFVVESGAEKDYTITMESSVGLGE